jgi:hypothetical protein
MLVYCRVCVDPKTGGMEEVGHNSSDIWTHFESKHPNVFEPFSSSYDDIEAKEALVEFLKIEG